jgi:RNA polymerase sigma-70 factor, ECF subfamily
MAATPPNSASDDSSATRTPRSLIERARSADPEAWAALVDLYGPLVLRWCRRWHLQDMDAADVLQDVFLAVSTHLAGFRKERATHTFRGWLRVILQNKVNDHFRRLGREPGGEGGTEAQLRFSRLAEADASGEGSVANDRSERVLFRRCCELVRGEFHDRTWKAFWRTAVEGKPAAEVADELGMSPVAVRVSKSRVLQRLREELGDM